MDLPPLETKEQRQIIAEEIAAKYQAFASVVSVSFHSKGILISVYPDADFKIPEGLHTVVVQREEY